MDYRFSFQRPMRRNSFCSMKGTIVDLVPAGQGGRRADGCLLFAAIEDTDGNTVNFFINPDTAVVVAEERSDRNVDVSYYSNSLVNEEQTLQLNLDGTVDVRTVNNQYFQASPANHNLVVIYSSSTRSIPAQTTPSTVVVLCDRNCG